MESLNMDFINICLPERS